MYKWTEREVEFIKSNKGRLKTSRMAKILHRSEFSVSDKINNLGLGDKRGEIKYWTENDEEFLKNNTDMSLKELSTQLGRTEGGVKFRKDKIGVKLKNDIERWTEEDEKFLIDNNSSMNYREIAKDLDRTETAVRHKMVRFGIFEERLPMIDKNRWTAEEDELLIKNKDMTIKELMVMFPNRKRIAIYSRKSIIGAIKKPKEWIEEEIQIIKDNLDKSDKEIAKILDRSATSIKTKRKKLGLLKVKPNQRWTEKEEKFLVENNNMDKNELAKRLGVSRRRVHGKLIEMDLIEKEEPGVAWSDEDINIVRKMVEGGALRAEIVEAFPDRTVNSIAGYIRKFQPPKKEKNRTRDGFVEILINNRYVHHHRYAMEQYLGRKLTSDESVHHLSFDRTDNRPGINLIILSKKQHGILHGSVKKMVKYLMKSGYVKYDRTRNLYIVADCKTDIEFRRKIYNDFKVDLNMVGNNEKIKKEILASLPNPKTSDFKPWTDDELRIIKENPNLTMYNMARFFPYRSVNVIRKKLGVLNYEIKKKEPYNSIYGYKMVTIDGKRVRKHRRVMELHLGRPLVESDIIHHINCDRFANNIENLVCFSNPSNNIENPTCFSNPSNSKSESQSAHRIAEASFNLCVPNLYNRGIVAYSPEQKSYILGENFIANDKNYELTG